MCHNMKIVNLTNKRIGKLVAIKINHKDKNKRYHWICKCDCGNEKIIRGDVFRKRKITSCGCERVAHNRINNRKYAIQKRLYLNSIQRRQKELGFDIKDMISLELFEKIIYKNCNYCGISPQQQINDNKFNGIKTSDEFIMVNGIDRKNNEIGYLENNIVPCCKHCNTAKMKMTQKEFKEFVCRIYEHYGRWE